MSETVTPLTAPRILLSGVRVLSNGTTQVVSDLEWSNVLSKDPNAVSFTVNEPVVFSGSVSVKIATDYPLHFCPPIPTVAENYNVWNAYYNASMITQSPGNDQTHGNVLYSLTEKLPNPTSCFLYYWYLAAVPEYGYGFRLVKPGQDIGYVGHTVEGVIPISAVVSIYGQLSAEALAYVKLM